MQYACCLMTNSHSDLILLLEVELVVLKESKETKQNRRNPQLWTH